MGRQASVVTARVPVVAAPEFQSTSSVVVVHRLSGSAMCGVFSDQG